MLLSSRNGLARVCRCWQRGGGGGRASTTGKGLAAAAIATEAGGAGNRKLGIDEEDRWMLWRDEVLVAVSCRCSIQQQALCVFRVLLASFSCSSQKKIDEAEAKRQEYEQQRDVLKTKIHSLNSIDMKVGTWVGESLRLFNL